MARKKRKAPWIDRRCCDWDTFLCSLMAAAERQQFPLLLVNWCEARRFWRQFSCTGAEVIRMQRAQEMNDALYNGYGERSQPGRRRWACEPRKTVANQASDPGVTVQGIV